MEEQEGAALVTLVQAVAELPARVESSRCGREVRQETGSAQAGVPRTSPHLPGPLFMRWGLWYHLSSTTGDRKHDIKGGPICKML